MCQFLKKELETIAHTQEDKLFLMLESNPKMFGMVISDFHELDRKVLSTCIQEATEQLTGYTGTS